MKKPSQSMETSENTTRAPSSFSSRLARSFYVLMSLEVTTRSTKREKTVDFVTDKR